MQTKINCFRNCSLMILTVLLTACYSSGTRTVQYPGGSEDPSHHQHDLPQKNHPSDTPALATVSDKDTHLQMDFSRARFESYAIDLEQLYYSLIFKDEAGTAIVEIPRSRLEFNKTSQTGTIKIKVKNGSVGYVSLRIDDNIENNDKFDGTSEKITANGDTRVKMKLKKLGDATLTISVAFDDANDTDNSSELPAALKARVEEFGNPQTWAPPTLAQIEKIAGAYCVSCHPSEAPGDALSRDFYTTKRIKEYMANKRMPYPGSNDANELNDLAEAGFDYRAAMVRYAESLGNTN